MRPTGPLHLGHLLGAIENWIKIQKDHECFFMVADLHALMGEYEAPQDIQKNSFDMIADWLACGIDPEKSTLFIQSHIHEHSELAIILGMMMPLGWLERNPTYKEQLREIKGRDLLTYGFLGYPVLQAADIFLYKATQVPVGDDQLSHLELARELARRFKHLYKKEIFPEPKAMLTQSARVLGIDRRKMSKSYGNAINLSDTEETIKKKVTSMITDPARVRLEDPGHPDVCNVYSYYKTFATEERQKMPTPGARRAKKGAWTAKRNWLKSCRISSSPYVPRERKFWKVPDLLKI